MAEIIRCDVPGTLPWDVLHRRHPAIIADVLAAHPYPPAIRTALAGLRAEITGELIEPLPPTAADRAEWDRLGDGIIGGRWVDAPFLFAESLFYRKLLAATGYFDDGPWAGVDPFGPAKAAGLADPGVAAELSALDDVLSRPDRPRRLALILAALWGNRVDLAFRLDDPQAAGRAAAELLADDTDALLDALAGAAGGTVCVVADNAGAELLPDLVLIDELLGPAGATAVALHLKPAPYFVSDAGLPDLLAALERLRVASETARGVADRLSAALRDGRLEVLAHPFGCAPVDFREMPADLAGRFAEARLTVLKGDLNYRRLLGDRYWPPATPFDELTGYFPGPVAALRTLKSDVTAGLPATLAAGLDRDRPGWRTAGSYAVVQVSGSSGRR